MIYKVVLANSSECLQLNERDFEKTMGIKLAHGLEFQKEGLLNKIKKRCKKAANKELISKRQKWLGEYFAKEIREDQMPDITIRFIDDKIGYGVFANCDIPAHSYIGEYTGVLKRKWWFSERKNNYLFVYSIGENQHTHYVIDAKLYGNHTRFINHSIRPNLEPTSVYCDGVMHIILRATKPIAKGTQLTYDYGEEYWTNRKKSLSTKV